MEQPLAGRVARTLSEFWGGGGGPTTHRELNYLFEEAGIHSYPVEAEGSKRDRVQDAIASAAGTKQFWPLIETLVTALRDDGFLAAGRSEALDRDIRRFRSAIEECGRGLDDDGNLVGVRSDVAQTADTVLSVPVLRQHIERLRAAAERDDAEHVLGVAKELIESTVGIVLRETGTDAPADASMARKAKLAQTALLLHGSVHDVPGELGQRVKTILSSLSQIASATVELRNRAGTGHGRVEVAAGISRRHAKLVAGSAIVYCEMLLDTLNDPTAPWQQP